MRPALRKEKMIDQEKDQDVRRMRSKEETEGCCVTGDSCHKGRGGLGSGCKLMEAIRIRISRVEVSG